MRTTTAAALALFLAAACGNDTTTPAGYSDAGPMGWVCFSPGTACAVFESGWTETEAADACSSGLEPGTACPSGHVATCRQTVGAKTIRTHYYAGFGAPDATDPVAYALETCQYIGGEFSAP